ncbi:helix-hairpin-helix domain-containing protein [Halorubrum sp. 2020YC2]|uniref:helix-hairpin-helix domain-containing protein n=1 Tax=Halorubrum sp. 2020YC2 TaxID=2836432 RepID=UPI001BE50EE8|nr:helix-hairpin-helix domain-containing protein [Halorubrum sp. 2020YC2]QWC19649.1 helix-hairpin-helix domain-containing protein [Halorubrum sp. 2020YC2]
MALLQKLKEKLGFGSGSAERESGETEVTVERESEPAAEASAEATDEQPPRTGVDEEGGEPAAAAATEAAASTESLVDEEAGATDDAGTEADEGAEPAEAAAGEADDAAVDGDDRGPSVEEIKGIGPAYAERLASIGIETIDDLAGADAAEVAEGTSVGEKRAATWIDRASEF